MRIWSINPKYLDTIGLVAFWRETLLAQNVLLGNTKGYKNHSQLIRFKNHKETLKCISYILYTIYLEANQRNYNFNKEKIKNLDIFFQDKINLTKGQLEYEFKHLLNKLEKRDYTRYKFLVNIDFSLIEPNPIFNIVEGDIEPWEIL